MSPQTREIPAFARLLEIVRELRERCPWDREQTLASVGRYLLEEAYETADALAHGDDAATAEELGDLLSQVLLAGVVAEQQARGEVATLLQSAADKLVRRHPHIYGDAQAHSADEVVALWNRIKRAEREAKGSSAALDGVARNLPALMRAEKLGMRARQAGMDWADIHQVLAKVREEMGEVEGALARDDLDGAAAELGDMLLALANAPRFIGHDAEEALRRSCDKFTARFSQVERIARERGWVLTAMSPQQLEALWQEAKQMTRQDD